MFHGFKIVAAHAREPNRKPAESRLPLFFRPEERTERTEQNPDRMDAGAHLVAPTPLEYANLDGGSCRERLGPGLMETGSGGEHLFLEKKGARAQVSPHGPATAELGLFPKSPIRRLHLHHPSPDHVVDGLPEPNPDGATRSSPIREVL